jgi:hypothetical protein
MNRRNVLTGLGGLAISGGALFGTGAFTSVSAEREVKVNILGAGGNLGAGAVEGDTDDSVQEDIADSITEGAVDVLVDLSPESVAVRTQAGDVIDDGSELYPSPNDDSTGDSIGSSVYSSDPGFSDSSEEQYVSLVANDVTIVFGSSTGLPQNSTLTYDSLFAFADPNGNTPDVNFYTSSPTNDPLLTKVDGTDPSSTATVSSSDSSTVNAKVASGSNDGATEDLDIGIGVDPSA